MPEDIQHSAVMHCEDCERLDDLIFINTRIIFFLPTSETYSKLAGLCGRKELVSEPIDDRSISVEIKGYDVHNFVVALYGIMSQQELKNVKVLTTDGSDPKISDFSRVINSDVFINRIKGSWIIERVRNRHIDTWYQPIIDLKTEETFGMEALLRVKDQDNQIIPPDFVFRLAEDADVLFSVDLIARANAVETAARHGVDKKIFINFNPSSIYDPAYCLRLTATVINELGLKPSDIVFEITETEKISDVDHLRGILAFYRRAGFMCALDDIGSGWSSLNFLHSFNPDFVKLDMELIRDINKDQFKQSIVRHLIEIAKEQEIKVIAEGIETVEEAKFVKNLGADYGQGYLYARPSPLS